MTEPREQEVARLVSELRAVVEIAERDNCTFQMVDENGNGRMAPTPTLEQLRAALQPSIPEGGLEQVAAWIVQKDGVDQFTVWPTGKFTKFDVEAHWRGAGFTLVPLYARAALLVPSEQKTNGFNEAGEVAYLLEELAVDLGIGFGADTARKLAKRLRKIEAATPSSVSGEGPTLDELCKVIGDVEISAGMGPGPWTVQRAAGSANVRKIAEAVRSALQGKDAGQ